MIGVVRRPADLRIILAQRWYRVPARQIFSRRPRYLAFYQTKSCGSGGASIRYYAAVRRVSCHIRQRLLPEEKSHPRAEDRYWKFQLRPARKLPHPIRNKSRRRITFAWTTLSRLRQSSEIGELFAVPPLEEILSRLLKKARIAFTPQFCVMHKRKCKFRVDFAVFCGESKFAIECDHSRWHKLARQRKKDSRKDSWLARRGWKVMRFSEKEIMERPADTIQAIREQISESLN